MLKCLCAPFGLLALSLCANVASSAANGATLTTMPGAHGTIITLRGDITREDAAALATVLDSIPNAATTPVLRLDSPGGTLLGGVDVARIVQQHPRLATMVVNGATCASACFLVFAAGHKKIADYRSFVGVHGVGDKFGKVTEETRSATRAMARFSAELGVPSTITQQMIATPPDEIIWLTGADLRAMGATMIGRPLQALRGASGQRPEPRSGPTMTPTAALPRPLSELIGEAARAARRADYATAVQIWRQLAAHGHAASQYNLGEMYDAGRGVPQDFREAVKWYRLAAERGVPQAQLSLGVAYALGHGIDRDLTRADTWLMIASDNAAIGADRAQVLKARAIVETRMTLNQVAEATRLAHEWTVTN